MKDPPRVTEGDSLHEAVSLMQENGHQAVIMVGPTARAALCA